MKKKILAGILTMAMLCTGQQDVEVKETVDGESKEKKSQYYYFRSRP